MLLAIAFDALTASLSSEYINGGNLFVMRAWVDQVTCQNLPARAGSSNSVSIEHCGLAWNFQGLITSPSEVVFFSSYMYGSGLTLFQQIDSYHIQCRKML